MITDEPPEATVPLSRLQAIAVRSYVLLDSLANRIIWCLEHRAKSSRLFIGCMIGLLVLISFRHAAHAQAANTPHLIDSEVSTAYSLAIQFDLLGNAIALAQYIFATLAGLTVIINCMAYYIRNQSIKGLGQVVLSSVLRLGVPFVIIGIAPTVLPAISLVGLQIADVVTGTPNSGYGNGTYADAPPPDTIQTILSDLYNKTFGAATNNNHVTVTPSNIARFGENIGFTIIDEASCVIENGGTWDAKATPSCTNTATANTGETYRSDSQVMQVIIILAIGIIGTFIFIAVELVIAYLQIYIVLPIAAFSLGFLGAPATRQYGAGYWTVVVGALLKFVTVVFTIGFAITLANQWATILGGITFAKPVNGQAGQTDVHALEVAISYSMAAFSLLYIIRVLPALFQGVLNGASGSAEGNQAEYQGQFVGRSMQSPGAGLARSGRSPANPGQTIPGSPTRYGGPS